MKFKYLVLCLMFIVPNIVKGENVFFKNNNNVVLTKEEYDYIVKRFDNEFPYIMSETDYNHLVKNELLNGKMNIVTDNNVIMPLDTEHTTQSKSLKISSICDTEVCSIVVTLNWIKIPSVRSYDVMGAYLKNTSLIGSVITHVKTDLDTVSIYDYDSQTNGFGVSFKLFDGNNVKIYQYYDTKAGGTIYASYQHAKEKTTLSESKKYTLSLGGYGRVFSFDSSVRDKYDAMGGVYINL